MWDDVGRLIQRRFSALSRYMALSFNLLIFRDNRLTSGCLEKKKERKRKFGICSDLFEIGFFYVVAFSLTWCNWNDLDLKSRSQGHKKAKTYDNVLWNGVDCKGNFLTYGTYGSLSICSSSLHPESRLHKICMYKVMSPDLFSNTMCNNRYAICICHPLFAFGLSLYVEGREIVIALMRLARLTQHCTPGTGIMEADDRQVMTIFTVQPSFHHRHSTN